MRVQNQSRDLLSSILPRGKGLVLMLKFYADESIGGDRRFMNVSGLLLKEEQFAYLDDAVRDARGDLPYFHMCEGHHTSHPKVYESLCRLMNKENVMVGISAGVKPEEHNAIAKLQHHGQSLGYWTGTTYTYLLNLLMSNCRTWLTEHRPSDELIAYVFEGGHANQGDANAFMGRLCQPRLVETRQSYRYASHAFVDGKGPLGSVLQLADIFAWHMNREALGLCTLNEVALFFGMNVYARDQDLEEIAETIAGHKNVWNHEKRTWEYWLA